MNLDDLMVVADMPATDPATQMYTATEGPGRRAVLLRPIDAGFVLTWKEYRKEDGPFQEPELRRGMVLGMAPDAETVWVIPDESRDGEGYAVVVRQVVSTDAGKAARWVEGKGDFRSTAGWQRPRSLPRALLRVDRHEGSAESMHFLHSQPDCPAPAPFPGETIVRGEPSLVEECYVFDRWLHTVSTRPVHPGLDAYVPPCGVCLLPGQPK